MTSFILIQESLEMTSFIFIQESLDLITVQDFGISFYVKKKEKYGHFYSFNYDFVFWSRAMNSC